MTTSARRRLRFNVQVLLLHLPFRGGLHAKNVVRGGELELGRPLVHALESLPDTRHAGGSLLLINPELNGALLVE